MVVLLGFVDDLITEYYADKIDYTTNKLGGFPDWIATQSKKQIRCRLCGSTVPLLLQVYAPIKERLQHHRTLYIFACINSNCWGNSESWICLKSQSLAEEKFSLTAQYTPNEEWCSDANNWDDDESSNPSEVCCSQEAAASLINRVSLLEENANEVPRDALVNLQNHIPTAEIEPDENEPITIESPVLPNSNLIKLLKQKPASPQMHNDNIYFIPSFICAIEEKTEKDPLSEHVQNLLNEYSRNSGDKNCLKMNNVNLAQQSEEKYEKSQPPHGDKLFHTFLSRIKTNPDQILRYCRRNSAPLFLYPESDIPTKCKHCHSDMIFEMQILPTIISYLKLSSDNRNHKDRIEFGSAFIYTCKQSCDKSEEEYVVVQQEKI